VSIRIMATADVHLGMKFAAYRTVQTKLIEARFDALRNVVAAANEKSCNLLVVAGDLFHRVGVASPTILKAAQILNEFSGDVVAVLPGNHDFVSPDKDRLWGTFRDVCGDRTLLMDTATAFDLRPYDVPAVVLAAPCDSLHGHDHRLGWIDEYQLPDDVDVIGVAHGSIDGITLDAEGQYFPMTRQQLAALPPSVWIVGHTHRLHDLRQARTVVPGTPEPDGFDFADPGRAAYIEMEAGSYTATAVETGTYRFADVRIELDRAEAMNTQVERAVPADSLVRLKASGMVTRDQRAELNSAVETLRSSVVYLEDDLSDVTPLVTREDVDATYSTGSFSHTLLTRLLDDDDADGAAVAAQLLSEAQQAGGPA